MVAFDSGFGAIIVEENGEKCKGFVYIHDKGAYAYPYVYPCFEIASAAFWGDNRVEDIKAWLKNVADSKVVLTAWDWKWNKALGHSERVRYSNKAFVVLDKE
jgi:hypothetical protein